MYTVYAIDAFDKLARKQLSPEQYRKFPAIMQMLATKKIKGKCLRIPWLWELKARDKRLYFVVHGSVVVFVDISDKDEQRDVIAVLQAQKERLLAKAEEFRRNE